MLAAPLAAPKDGQAVKLTSGPLPPSREWMRSDPMYDQAHIPPRIDWWRVVELVGKAVTVIVMAGLLWGLLALAVLTLGGASYATLMGIE